MPIDPDLEILGKRIRAQRHAAGLSQEELAHRADLHRNYVGLIERGERNVSAKTLFVLAKALGIGPVEFWR